NRLPAHADRLRNKRAPRGRCRCRIPVGPTPSCPANPRAPAIWSWRRSSSFLRGPGRSRNQIGGVAADGCSPEPSREQRLEEARARIKVPVHFHHDRYWRQFLEGCPANHAVVSAEPCNGPAGTLNGTFLPARELC